MATTTANSRHRANENYNDILRGPHQVAFDLTNRCNLRCRHCFNSSGENAVMQDELSDEMVRKLALSLADLRPSGCCLCGGEPLLRLEGALGFISAVAPNVGVGMVSNGLLLTKTKLDSLVDAGLTNIQFSLDGLQTSHDGMRRMQGAFDRVWSALKMTMDEPRLALSIAFCPTSFNIDDFDELVDRLHDLYLHSKRAHEVGKSSEFTIRVQPLMLLGRARKNPELRPTGTQYRRLVEMINRKRYRYEREGSFCFEWGDPIEHIVAFQQSGVTMSQVSIRANGDITVSPYIPLVVGNVRRHTLSEYWRAGLSDVWETVLVRELASRVFSISSMESLSEDICDINMGGDIRTDIIEADELDDMSLLEGK